MLENKNLVLGVCGGIAAYKGLDIVSRLKKLNANVDVIMTASATQFVAPLSFQSLSQNPVAVNMFDQPKYWEIEHIALAKKADLLLVAPASANMLGKVANGVADDMLSTVIMAAKAPVVFAPAMNTNMYENPIVQSNIKKLKDLGYSFVEPGFGRLACGDTGRGKLAEVDDIIDEIKIMLNDKKDYRGSTVLITAGPTVEAIDPVRYISNHSSGKMGYALAECARNRGANVILVTGPTCLKPPRGVEVINVTSNKDMYEAVMDAFDRCDVVIKAAAVADYRPSITSTQKIKKFEDELVLRLEKNTDILSELGKRKGNKTLVGFAAESQDLIDNAKVKVLKKNLDLIVANDITVEGSGFGSSDNVASLINREGHVFQMPKMSKYELSDAILDNIKLLK